MNCSYCFRALSFLLSGCRGCSSLSVSWEVTLSMKPGFVKRLYPIKVDALNEVHMGYSINSKMSFCKIHFCTHIELPAILIVQNVEGENIWSVTFFEFWGLSCSIYDFSDFLKDREEEEDDFATEKFWKLRQFHKLEIEADGVDGPN